MSADWHSRGRAQILDHAALLLVSILCICLELFFTRILNLKTWNHVVYVVIPFAILGCGVGANLYLILKDKISAQDRNQVIGLSLALLTSLSMLATRCLIHLPLSLVHLLSSFQSLSSGMTLSLAYAIVAVPFVAIGFLIVFLFMEDPQKANRLYFWNLLGSGLGAVAFFFLIARLEVFRSIAFLCLGTAVLSTAYLAQGKKWPGWILILVCLAILGLPEPANYAVDPAKHWEWIPGYFKKDQYERVLSKWHPYGRTDAYRFTDPQARQKMCDVQPGTFQIDLHPVPEFIYFCTNFLAGSPVYKLSSEGMAEYGVGIRPFSQAMEFPYLILREPRVVVIGTGGGRDVFMAKTHGAPEVLGAEINPAIHAAMSKGGKLYEYSGKVYQLPGVQVFHLDGRQLVKRLPDSSCDLIILNGVDTFSGLSSGAYAYVESYLYTKEAIEDYLRILRPGGAVNLNRWFFQDRPRETLRLFVICLDALRRFKAAHPWEHVVVGQQAGWGMVLVKKTPFTDEERTRVAQYFREHGADYIFPTPHWQDGDLKRYNAFEAYAYCLTKGYEEEFIARYPDDISVVTDDNPFFYKYYRFKDLLRSWKTLYRSNLYTGTVVFFVQILVLVNAILFTLLTIIVPLAFFQRKGIEIVPRGTFPSFLVYFGCLGVGFMFIEISAMQRFTLLLGNPIHAISVSLAALLIFSGFGSLALTKLQGLFKDRARLLLIASLCLAGYLVALAYVGARWLDSFMGLAFVWRVLLVVLAFLPLGFCLGLFFPSGLQVVGAYSKEAIAWAFAINCGFTVLGSMLAVILAQFWGFRVTLLLAAAAYSVAGLVFSRLAGTAPGSPASG